MSLAMCQQCVWETHPRMLTTYCLRAHTCKRCGHLADCALVHEPSLTFYRWRAGGKLAHLVNEKTGDVLCGRISPRDMSRIDSVDKRCPRCEHKARGMS